MNNQKAEITTLLSIITLIAITIFTFVTANINTNTAKKQTTSNRATGIENCGRDASDSAVICTPTVNPTITITQTPSPTATGSATPTVGPSNTPTPTIRIPAGTTYYDSNGNPTTSRNAVITCRTSTRGVMSCTDRDENPIDNSRVHPNLTPTATPTPRPTRTPRPTSSGESDPYGRDPTNTPTPGEGTPTVTPTPRGTITNMGNPNGVDMTFNMKLKFQGIVSKPRDQFNKMVVKIALIDAAEVTSGNRIGTNEAEFVATDSGIFSGTARFSHVAARDGYYLLIKGPKHVQKRICSKYVTETAPGAYNCDATLTLNRGENVFNLTDIYMMSGDLPYQNGVVNAEDFGNITTTFGMLDFASLRDSDVNLDGVINSQDFSLIMQTLLTTDGTDQY